MPINLPPIFSVLCVPFKRNWTILFLICHLILFLTTFRDMPNLQLQTRLPRANSSRKNTVIDRELADEGMELDTPVQPTPPLLVLKDELEFFRREMKSWVPLRTPWKEFLTTFSDKVIRETECDVGKSQFVRTLSYLKNIHYGVNNCMAHLCGQLISRAIKQSKKTTYTIASAICL